MAELIVLAVICVGLYNRGGRKFEWSRRSLSHAARAVTTSAGPTLSRGLRNVPAIVGQCIIDMRSLFDDTLGLLDPKARRRIEERARGVLARAEHRANLGNAGGPRLAATAQPASSHYQTLQQRYLEGSITLDRYVEEAQRLRPPG
jgi:hypothetical protein